MNELLPMEERPHCCGRAMESRGGKAQSGRVRYRCGKCGSSTTGSPESDYELASLGYDRAPVKARLAMLRQAIKAGANRFVITAAANNSAVDSRAWRSLMRLCEDRQAHLIVIPIHYKNISLYTAAQQYRKWWTKPVQPFLIDEPLRLGAKTWVMGDIRIQATAADPLSGLQPLAGDRWAIFGHSQIAMEPIATPQTRLPGRMISTGAITQPSYSRTKVGAKAAFHHVIGAQLVEVQGNKTFIRQLNADSKGVIHDLTDKYTPDGIERDVPAMSLTMGDEHVKWMQPSVKTATHSKRGLVAHTRPQFLVRHDILDGYAGSHHHIGQYLTQYKKWLKDWADYRAELDQVVAHINLTTPRDWPCTNLLVEDSNHHEHLDRWLNSADDRCDHQNADLICELRNLQRQAIRDGMPESAFRLYVQPRLKVPVEFLNPNVPYMLGGVDHSQHGHRGVNGARGSARALANTTHKLTIGHTHSARIVKSVYQVGKSCKTLEYERGLSSHTNTHCLQYQNGKRTLIDILGRLFRADNQPFDGNVNVSADFA